MGPFAKSRHPPSGRPSNVPSGPHGEEHQRPLTISLVDYSEGQVTERSNITAQACAEFLHTPTITWIHIQGEFKPDVLRALGATFSLHALALEDVITSGHRPKAEVYDGQLFVILSRPVWRDQGVVMEQVSIFYGEDLIISFYDGADPDPFQSVRKRLRQYNGWLRNRKSDYLFYDLIDVVIDAGFPLLEELGDRIENLEDALLDNPAKETLSELHQLKRDLLMLRRMIWPHREVVNDLMRGEFPLIQESTKFYLRDCYDHIVHIIELLEAYRDMTSSMLDVYLSSVSQRLNENMRLLTVIATVFMPLTFIAGVYGMNFDRAAGPWNMPELGWPYGYPLVLLVMFAVAVAMLIYFKRKKWL
jgi:magnesium transporter